MRDLYAQLYEQPREFLEPLEPSIDDDDEPCALDYAPDIFLFDRVKVANCDNEES